MRQFRLKLLVELVNGLGGGGAVLTQVALLFQALLYQSLREFKLRETKRYDVWTVKLTSLKPIFITLLACLRNMTPVRGQLQNNKRDCSSEVQSLSLNRQHS